MADKQPEITILFSIRYLLLQDLDFINTPRFIIHTNPSIRDSFLAEKFKRIIGFKAQQSFETNMFGYQTISIGSEVKEQLEIGDKLKHETYSTAKSLETFLFFLWFIKDNSISIDETYSYESITHQVNCKPNHTIFNNCFGEFENIQFSREEIDQTVNILGKYAEVCQAKTTSEQAVDFFLDDNNPQKRDTIKSSANYTFKENRLHRAISFLTTARSTAHLPYKVSLYMPILESLFSDSSSEITHKVSERAAFYIGIDKDEKRLIFKTIKEAYDIRSRFLHGQEFNPQKITMNYLKSLSAKIDQIVRKILTKIILEDSNNFLQSDHATFLNSLIFQ
jgi:hypothetical protein